MLKINTISPSVFSTANLRILTLNLRVVVCRCFGLPLALQNVNSNLISSDKLKDLNHLISKGMATHHRRILLREAVSTITTTHFHTPARASLRAAN